MEEDILMLTSGLGGHTHGYTHQHTGMLIWEHIQ